MIERGSSLPAALPFLEEEILPGELLLETVALYSPEHRAIAYVVVKKPDGTYRVTFRAMGAGVGFFTVDASDQGRMDLAVVTIRRRYQLDERGAAFGLQRYVDLAESIEGLRELADNEFTDEVLEGEGGKTAGRLHISVDELAAQISAADERAWDRLQVAIDRAAPGGTVSVPPGVHRGPLSLWKPVSLVGSGSRDDVVIESTDSDCVEVKGKDIVIQGLTIRALAASRYNAIFVHGGQVRLEDCVVTSTAASSIHATGALARLRMDGCEVANGLGGGVFIEKGASAYIDSSSIDSNASDGLRAVSSGTVVEVTGSVVSANAGCGVRAEEGARIALTDCTVEGNRQGIIVNGTGTSIVSVRSHVTHSEYPGVRAESGGTYTGEADEIEANGHTGITVDGPGSTVRLTGAKVHENQFHGVKVDGGGAAHLQHCLVMQNTSGGAAVGAVLLGKAGGSLELAECQVYQNFGAGVECGMGGDTTVVGGKLEENAELGLEIHGLKATTKVQDVQIADNRGGGISFYDGGHGQVVTTFVSANDAHGLVVGGRHTSASITDTRVVGNLGPGISVQDGGEATIEACMVSAAAGNVAIQVIGAGTNAVVRNSTLEADELRALDIEPGAQVTTEGNVTRVAG